MQNSEICVYLNTVSGVNCSFGKIVITQRSSVVTQQFNTFQRQWDMNNEAGCVHGSLATNKVLNDNFQNDYKTVIFF